MDTKSWRDIGKRSLFMLSLAVLLSAPPAGAEGILFLTGAEGGGGGGTYNYYTFAGIVAPVVTDSYGNGVVQKHWIEFLGYDYPAGDRDINATAIGLESALGYRNGGEKGWAGAYAGLHYSNTWLSPDNPESSVRGSQIRPLLQVEGERAVTADWRLNGMARYTFGADSHWGRGRIMYRLYDRVYTGPEFIAHGDADYQAWQGGWFVTGFEPLPGGSIGFKAGVRKIEKAESSAYLGVEFSQMF